jgi:hypothetical protein
VVARSEPEDVDGSRARMSGPKRSRSRVGCRYTGQRAVQSWEGFMPGLLYLLVIGSAIWVAVDASRLDAKRGALGGGLLDMGPAAWFFACLLFWIITLPCYLATRPKLVRRAQVLSTHPQFMASAAAAVPAHAAGPPMVSAGGYAHAPNSPAGWYTNSDGLDMRWWDGANWTSR